MNLDSKRIFWWALNIALIALILVLWKGAGAIYRYGASLAPARVISVSAEGEVVVVPDIARVNFSVITEGQDPVAIQSENTKKVNSAIDFVKSQSIAAEDIKTSQYNLSPRYEYDEERRRSFISGYVLHQSVALKIRDFTKISPILAGLPGKGVNEISQLQFDVDDPEIYLAQARQQAFAKARDKAATMARQNGVRVKRVVTFSESAGYTPPIIFAREAALGFGDIAPAPTIEPGSQEVKVQVTVTYEIR